MSEEAILEPGAGVRSIQQAWYRVSAAALEERWCQEGLACLARQYWRPIVQRSGHVLRLLSTDRGPRLVLAVPPLVLIRFDPPRYLIRQNTAEVSWAIGKGLLVATAPDQGTLRIMVGRRQSGLSQGDALLHLTVEVEGYQPRLRSRGRSARVGTWVYRQTQLRIHARQARAFMRSLAQKSRGTSGNPRQEVF